MGKIQFNPSTGKVSFNSSTNKVQTWLCLLTTEGTVNLTISPRFRCGIITGFPVGTSNKLLSVSDWTNFFASGPFNLTWNGSEWRGLVDTSGLSLLYEIYAGESCSGTPTSSESVTEVLFVVTVSTVLIYARRNVYNRPLIGVFSRTGILDCYNSSAFYSTSPGGPVTYPLYGSGGLAPVIS